MSLFSAISVNTKRRLFAAPVAIMVMLVIGALGFRFFTDYGWVDSIYLAAQTVTTVGYGDIAVSSAAGRIFATVYMLLGVGTVLYSLTVIAQAIVQSEIIDALNVSRKQTQMEKISDHYIVCGAGRVGRRVIRNIKKLGESCIIIETNEARVAEFRAARDNVIIGDATIEEVLTQAGVSRAKGLASCLPDDASNIYVVLTARGMNKDLHIVARAVEEQAEPKLIRAGANRVVAPTIIGSQSMARALLKPAIADFMDSIVAESLELVFEEVAIGEDSPYSGKKLSDTNISSELNIIVIALRRSEGVLEYHPNAETIVDVGDLLIVVGNAESVKKLVEVNN